MVNKKTNVFQNNPLYPQSSESHKNGVNEAIQSQSLSNKQSLIRSLNLPSISVCEKRNENEEKLELQSPEYGQQSFRNNQSKDQFQGINFNARANQRLYVNSMDLENQIRSQKNTLANEFEELLMTNCQKYRNSSIQSTESRQSKDLSRVDRKNTKNQLTGCARIQLQQLGVAKGAPSKSNLGDYHSSRQSVGTHGLVMDPYRLQNERNFPGCQSVLDQAKIESKRSPNDWQDGLRDSLNVSICNSRANRHNIGAQSLSPSKNSISQNNGQMILNLNPTLNPGMMRNGKTTNTHLSINGNGDFFTQSRDQHNRSISPNMQNNNIAYSKSANKHFQQINPLLMEDQKPGEGTAQFGGIQ